MIEPPIPDKNPLELLVFLLHKGATITKVSKTPVSQAMVCPIVMFEVTGIMGTQYVIHAYGKEASVLHEMAVKTVLFLFRLEPTDGAVCVKDIKPAETLKVN